MMTQNDATIPCSLCGHTATPYCADKNRSYFRCPECDLVAVAEAQHLDMPEEKSRYDLHQNDPKDMRYRAFLNRLYAPMASKLAPAAQGLDFGCGPGPTLSLMFEENGNPCAIFDLHYANDPSVLEAQYDFLTCSETMEHMYQPGSEFEKFIELVRPGGWIGIMTQLHNGAPVAFEKWHYKDDDTHVCFFSKDTFSYLAKKHDLQVEFHSDSVVLFQKKH